MFKANLENVEEVALKLKNKMVHRPREPAMDWKIQKMRRKSNQTMQLLEP